MSDEVVAKTVTVSDVARAAGVSKATAARALGGYGAVSSAVQARVDAAAGRLDYRPNQLAKSMSTGRTKSLGVVVGDIENPFFGRAVRGMTDVARTRDYQIVLANTGEEVGAEVAAVEMLLDRRVDGLIVTPASSFVSAHLAAVMQMGRPLVLLDRSVSRLEVDSVSVDNTNAARDAARHLIGAGHRRIAFVTSAVSSGPGLDSIPASSVRERLSGLLDETAAAGLENSQQFLRLEATGQAATDRIVADLLGRKDAPTAIIASDSLVGLNVFTALRETGIQVPDQMSLIVFDNADWTRITTPPITVIDQPFYQLGAQAANVLLARLAGDGAPPENHHFAAQLIRRSSVVPPEPVVRSGSRPGARRQPGAVLRSGAPS